MVFNSVYTKGGSITVYQEALAENLEALGLPVSPDESMDSLISKVLCALNGTEAFSATMEPAWDISYGVFTTGEIVSMDGMINISSASRIHSLKIVVVGINMTTVDSITPAGTGWSWTKGNNTITGVYESDCLLNMSMINAAFNGITLAGDGETSVIGKVTASAEGDSGIIYPVQGSAQFQYTYTATWALNATIYPTWGDAASKTWGELAQFVKAG